MKTPAPRPLQAHLLIIGALLIAAFFLACTKKPKAQLSAVPRKPNADGSFTTPHGYRVQFEPGVVAPQGSKKK